MKKTLPFLILLAAFVLRVWQLAEIPPGLTHDEAAHGHDAAHILKGVTLIYFTIGYGREPLFDYFNAGLIAGLGAAPFTLRFSAVIFGVLTLAATHRLARMLFNWETAVLALVFISVSFWPLATSRQILRSAMLPAELAVAAILFVHLNVKSVKGQWLSVIGLALAIAASLYTYIPARVLWLTFPLTLLAQYRLRITTPGTLAPSLRPLIAIPLAFALAAPLFFFLYQHPEAEQRIGTLSGPLVALQNGDWTPLVNNSREFLLAFFLPGHGDQFLAYNLPGQPIFDPISFTLFMIGLLVIIQSVLFSTASTRRFSPAAPLLLFWLILGLAPSLITGPEALTTRIIGAQPALYILPALGLSQVLTRLRPIRVPDFRFGILDFRFWKFGICALFFAALSARAARDYFYTWGQSPDVRAAYQSTLVTMLKSVQSPTVISTVYPAAPHDPYIGELMMDQETRWVDGRLALIVPADNDYALFTTSATPLHPAFAPWVQSSRSISLRPTDLDQTITLWRIVNPALEPNADVDFNAALKLIRSEWAVDAYRPGDVAEFLTIWRVLNPANLGVLRPPTFKTDLNLFTHVLNPDDSIFLQQDRLDAPSWDWQIGDTIFQIHQFAIPADAPPGDYRVEVGLYDRITGDRLLTQDGADHALVSQLIIR